MSKYKSNNNIVYCCKYHVVWCTKYRRKVLTEKVETRLKELLSEIAEKINVEIGSPVLMVINLAYLNKQANNFSRKELKVLKP